MDHRYIRNGRAIFRKAKDAVRRSKVFVSGCGSIGGFVIEESGRLGIGYITAADERRESRRHSLGRGNLLRQKLLMIDLLHHDDEVVSP